MESVQSPTVSTPHPRICCCLWDLLNAYIYLSHVKKRGLNRELCGHWSVNRYELLYKWAILWEMGPKNFQMTGLWHDHMPPHNIEPEMFFFFSCRKLPICVFKQKRFLQDCPYEPEHSLFTCVINSLFTWTSTFELFHEIMVLFVLHKLFLQTCMRSHPEGLDVWALVGPFIYFHTSCVRTAKARLSLSCCLCDKYHTLMIWAGIVIVCLKVKGLVRLLRGYTG